MRPKRLGRGLSQLITRTTETPPELERRAAPPTPATAGVPQAGVRGIAVASIRPNPYQPRLVFDPEGLSELAESIREHGMLQPIVVRAAGAGYEVVAGERRLRAAQALGLERVPVVLREATDQDMQTLALVENLQREDLNAMEKAKALKAMMRNFAITQEEVASRVGKARATIANLLRLLELPPEVQELVESGALTGAHARAVLQAQGAERRIGLARIAAQEGLSVREVERRARSGPTVGKRRRPEVDPYLQDIQDRLRRALGADVRVQPRGKGGRIELRYHDADDLDRLLELFRA